MISINVAVVKTLIYEKLLIKSEFEKGCPTVFSKNYELQPYIVHAAPRFEYTLSLNSFLPTKTKNCRDEGAYMSKGSAWGLMHFLLIFNMCLSVF